MVPLKGLLASGKIFFLFPSKEEASMKEKGPISTKKVFPQKRPDQSVMTDMTAFHRRIAPSRSNRGIGHASFIEAHSHNNETKTLIEKTAHATSDLPFFTS